jgi:ribonuclease BN (tRNA processing enzyme)
MDIEVLGSRGQAGAGYFTPSLLIDRTILLEAGAFASSLSLGRQLAIDHVLLSHAHHDHLRDLPGLADLVIGHRRRPVRVHACPGAMQVLREHLFNNQLWPDFFSLPSPDEPVFSAHVFPLRRSFRVGHLTVRAIPVNHPGQAVGFLVKGRTGSLLYSGDTGPTDEIWRAARRTRALRLVIVETKFPNDLQFVADAAGHLTPRTLAAELGKLGPRRPPVLLYHAKPDRRAEVRREVADAKLGRVGFLEIGARFRI